MEDSDDPSAQLLESSRFWIQRVLVPIVVFIGVAGNAVSVVVLTRKKMLCTTTIYLTALAVADVIYLIFVLILSFSHYPNIHGQKYEFYWSFYAISHWICDAASNTSVWLTVSFTVERYIVVCYPIRGKVICTEGRAKCIIAIVYVLSLLASFSTLFEYELYSHCVDWCPPKVTKPWENLNESYINELQKTHKVLQDKSPSNIEKLTDIYKYHESKNTEHLNTTIESINKHYDLSKKLVMAVDDLNQTEEICCSRKIGVNSTSLALNKTYERCFFWFTSLFFAIIPLILIAIINFILVYTMFKSRTKRRRMTIRRKENSSQTQENRITLLLIVVIILFLICQTPTASFLIYDTLDPDNPNKDHVNYKKTCGNIFNFLLNLNAALNFVLYCAFSEKYRRTFKELFCQKTPENHEVFGISRLSQRATTIRDRFDRRRNQSEYLRTPRNLETSSLPLRSKSLMARTGKNEIFRI